MAATKNIFRAYHKNKCSDEDDCCNAYTNTEEDYAEVEEGVEMDNAEENDLEDERMKM